MPGSFLGFKDTAMNKPGAFLSFMELIVYWEKKKKQMISSLTHDNFYKGNKTGNMMESKLGTARNQF